MRLPSPMVNSEIVTSRSGECSASTLLADGMATEAGFEGCARTGHALAQRTSKMRHRCSVTCTTVRDSRANKCRRREPCYRCCLASFKYPKSANKNDSESRTTMGAQSLSFGALPCQNYRWAATAGEIPIARTRRSECMPSAPIKRLRPTSKPIPTTGGVA